MKLNILHVNIERNKHLDKVLGLLREKNPDIVCLEEAMLLDVKKISQELKYEFAFAPRVIIKTNESEEEEGSAILSKYKIRDTNIYRYDDNAQEELFVYTENKMISKNGERREDRFLLRSNFLTIGIEGDTNNQITIATTHFPVVDHTTFGLLDHELDRMQDIDEIEHTRDYLDKLVGIIRSIPEPVIFTADLNNTRGEYVYDTLAHELRDIVPISVVSTIDPVLHRKHNLNLVVDTIMISSDIVVNDFELIEGVSDHKALVASLSI